MAFTFLKIMHNTKIGNSLFDVSGSKIVLELVEKAKNKNVSLYFPVDFVTADKFSASANTSTASIAQGIPEGWQGLDCGPLSNEIFRKVVLSSKTVLWNG